MDQNQPVDTDLQKAIDDITNTTNVDPVFSDPVAAPSSVPEGDTGELSEPVGPFPEDPKVEMLPPAPEPIAPLESVNIPELNMPPFEQPTEPEQNLEDAIEKGPEPTSEELSSAEKSELEEVKTAALRDLIPLIGKLDMEAPQKFNIYKDAFEDLGDKTVLDPAYKTAKEISDEKERAEALLFLVESIDNM